MSRLGAGFITDIVSKVALEPVAILEIKWTSPLFYSTKVMASPEATIPFIDSIGAISESIAQRTQNSIFQTQVTIKDPSGVFWEQAMSEGLENRIATVSAAFSGNATSKTDLFQGKVQGPLEWDESAQTVTFEVVGQIPELDFGYAPTVEDLTVATVSTAIINNYDLNKVGTPWPTIFGAPMFSPTVRITKKLESKTLAAVTLYPWDPTGPVAQTNTIKVAKNEDGTGPFNGLELTLDYLEISGHVFKVFGQSDEDDYYEYTIGSGTDYSSSSYYDEYYNALKYSSVALADRDTGDPDHDSPNVFWVANPGVQLLNNVVLSSDLKLWNTCVEQTGRKCKFADPWFEAVSRDHVLLDSSDSISNVRSFPAATNYTLYKRRARVDGITLPAGSTVRYWNNGFNTEVYVANWQDYLTVYNPVGPVIVETNTTVNGVFAYRTDPVSTARKLTALPYSSTLSKTYYTVETVECGGYVATAIELRCPLSDYRGEGWEEDIFVVAKSSIQGGTTYDAAFGNIVSMISAVQEITEGSSLFDTSVIAASTAVASIPASFTITDKRSFTSFMADLAWQARCRLSFNGATYGLNPIFGSQTLSSTITLNDDIIVQGKVKETYTETVDLTNRAEYKWRPSENVQDNVNTLYVVGGQGYKAESWDIYAYNNWNAAWTPVDFWLRRYGYVWRQYECVCTLKALDYKVFDIIYVNIPGHTPGSTTYAGEVLASSWAPGSNEVTIKVQIPVQVGATAADPNYWS